jgi:drug/metabolite transporter (DMT)-like permease
MTASSAHHLKTYILLLFIILFAPLGNVLLGKGMRQVGSAKNWSPSELFPIVLRVASSPYVWLGLACLLTFFVSHMLILTWADYSYVQPLTALAYFTVAVLSQLLLNETVTPLRWSGIALIGVGVFIVGRTAPNTTAVRPDPTETVAPLA